MDAFTLVDANDDFIIINKAPNINFHDEGDIGAGLFNQVKKSLKLDELYPVHRLDKMTSGLVIFAKNQATAAQFQKLFSHHNVEKYYLAVSDQKPKKKQGLIRGDMAKSRRGMWKLLRSSKSPAITQFFSHSIASGIRGFIVKPHSGKTHQIRVALASIGAPIMGDSLYAKSASDRGYLHAFALRFQLHDKHYAYSCVPKIGEYFLTEKSQQWFATINPPWELNWPKLT